MSHHGIPAIYLRSYLVVPLWWFCKGILISVVFVSNHAFPLSNTISFHFISFFYLFLFLLSLVLFIYLSQQFVYSVSHSFNSNSSPFPIFLLSDCSYLNRQIFLLWNAILSHDLISHLRASRDLFRFIPSFCDDVIFYLPSRGEYIETLFAQLLDKYIHP
jgi:hypothetical protein